MEFCLVFSQKFQFGGAINTHQTVKRITHLTVENLRHLGVNQFGEHYSEKLESLLVQNSGFKRQRLNEPLNDTLHINLTSKPASGPKALLTLWEGSSPGSGIFSRLKAVCGDIENFKVNLDLEFGTDEGRQRVEAKQRKLKILDNIGFLGFKINFNFTEAVAAKWTINNELIDGKVTIILELNDKALNLLHFGNLNDEPLSIGRKMLADTETADVVIIPGSGGEVKCHKVFLTVHSDVFKAMFQNEMRETLTSKIEIADMTEASVRALLAYLYCWDITEAAKSCSMALDLLLAADKYSIPSLLNSVKDLILGKDLNWFNVSVALHLLQFGKSKSDNAKEEDLIIYKSIECKAAAVLRSKSEMELDACPDYQDIFKDPKMGRQLCSYFITNC